MLYGMTFRRPWLLGGMFGAIVLVGGLALGCGTGVLSHWGTNRRVSFSRDIRPILNQNCVPCHGGVRQKNGVSFIFREEALGVGKSGRRTIVPGKPDESELIARVTSKDPDGAHALSCDAASSATDPACSASGSRRAPSGRTTGPLSRQKRSRCLR